MTRLRHLTLTICLWLGFAPFAAAQSVRAELLALLPDDFAVCIVMHDLRGNAARWERSDWLRKFRQTPLGKSYLDTPEMKQLERWQREMQKHLDLDWPTLRDDILGDTLIFAYTPGPKDKPADERGLFLLQVRKADRLVHLIDRLNDVQKIKPAVIEYKGSTYFHREEKGKSQFYVVKDSLAAVTSKEAVLRAYLDRLAAPPRDNPWARRFRKAGADTAFVTMCVNPRSLDAEVLRPDRKDDPLPGYWRALEAIFVTGSIRDDAEVRIAIQADVARLPEWAKGAFTQTIPTSDLWQRFPERSIMTVASRTDFSGAADALKLLMPEKDQKRLTNDLQGSIGALLRLDPFKDILPNLGPDWGLCILPSKDGKQVPQGIFALAVKPGAKDPPIDQTLFKAVELFAGIAVLKHNEANPNSHILVKKVMQDKVEVKYLANDKFFPAGFQPACALKDGYLLFATTPDAIAAFRLHDQKQEAGRDSPMLRVSAPELARLLDQRRDHILASLTEKDARKNLDNMISVFGLFHHLTLSQHGGDGQASWSIRLTPAR